MFPVPKAMSSSKVNTILLSVAIAVAPSIGTLALKVGAVISFTVIVKFWFTVPPLPSETWSTTL